MKSVVEEMKKSAMLSMLVIFSLLLVFLPLCRAEAVRGSLDRAGVLAGPSAGVVRTPVQQSPDQPGSPERPDTPGSDASGTPLPPASSVPSVPSGPEDLSGSSRFSRSERTSVPTYIPSGGGSTPAVPSEPAAPAQKPDQTPPPSQETLQVPAAPAWLNANEAKGFKLLNETRIKNNLKPVNISLQLTEAARLKAQDLIDNNYFAHVSPTLGSIGTMLRNAGISFTAAAENLSKAGNISQCHLQLEYSTQGHRQVMLNPGFNNVGIAVLPLKGIPGILMVQIYTD